MFERPSLMARVAAAKTVGFAIGLAGLILMPVFLPEAGWLPRIGIVLWYTTVGAFIGLAGAFTLHPILKLPMPWWFRDPCIGAWMNFVLAFFAWDMIGEAMEHTFGPDGIIQSPFWVTLEGAVVGLVIGYVAFRFGGEGKETVEAL